MFADGPGFDAAAAQVSREVGRKPMEREHPFGPYQINQLQQLGIVGVVGKRERRIAPVAENGGAIECPTRNHRGTLRRNPAEKRRVLALRRADDHVTGQFVGGELAAGRQSEAEFPAGFGQTKGFGVQHHFQPGGSQDAEQFLAFTQAVGEKDWSDVVGERALTKLHEVSPDLLGRREDVLGAPEGCFHDEHVCHDGRALLGGEAGAKLEIPRVKQTPVLGVIEQAERGAENVPGRQHGDGRVAGELFGLAIGQAVLDAPPGHARMHQSRGGGGAEDFLVPGAMVGMRMRNESAVGGLLRIQPPADLRQPDPLLELDIPRHGSVRSLRLGRYDSIRV